MSRRKPSLPELVADLSPDAQTRVAKLVERLTAPDDPGPTLDEFSALWERMTVEDRRRLTRIAERSVRSRSD